MAEQDKVIFCSAGWVSEARKILEELVATHGKPGHRFSLCEEFTDAPSSISIDGTVAWHFRIDGKRVEVSNSRAEDVDLIIRADYQATLPAARLVYTPEILAQRAASRRDAAVDDSVIKGSREDVPGYLIELHNSLAVITA